MYLKIKYNIKYNIHSSQIWNVIIHNGNPTQMYQDVVMEMQPTL